MSASLMGGRLPSPIGEILLAWDEEGVLRALDFDDHAARFHRLLARHYGPHALVPGDSPPAVRDALGRFFAGDLVAIDALAVRTNGSDFQRRVWAALRGIPPTHPTTYGRLAAAIGAPTASRAVGLANGANPIAIVVPCHRVVGADGSLTGYGGGLDRKRWLLDHERRHVNE